MKLQTIKTKLRSLVGSSHKNMLVVACLIAVTFTLGLMFYFHAQRNKLPDQVANFSNKELAYDFVSTWGTYNSNTYPQYTEELKAKMTPEYYNNIFGGEQIALKHKLLTESRANFVTLPVDSVDHVEVSDISEEGFSAVVYSEEESIDVTGESYFDQIAYRVSFVQQGDKYLVSNIEADRFSEHTPHEEHSDN